MSIDYSLEYASEVLDISRRQLNNLIGSNKVQVILEGGERLLRAGEMARLEWMLPREFYIVYDGERVRGNSRYCEFLTHWDQDTLISHFNKGEIEGVKKGNCCELFLDSLRDFCGRDLPATPWLEQGHPAGQSPPASVAPLPGYRR